MSNEYPKRWAALVFLLVAEAMNLLDATIVQVAAPVIHTRLGGSDSAIQWFTAAYTLPFAVLLITGGRLGDIAGRRRVFRVGVAGFVLASLVCALSGSPGMLIATRAVQGACAALIIPQTFGLIRGMFEGAELAKALSTIGPVMGLAAVCGPVLGGVLTHALSWRAVFAANIPLGVAVLVGSGLLPSTDRRRLRPDVVGTALAVVGCGLVVYPLIERTAPWLMAAGVVVLVVFALHQRRGGGLVETSLFTNRAFPAALATSVLFFAVVNGLMLVVVLRVQLTSHADVLTAGLTLVPWSAGMAVASLAAGSRLFPRFGERLMPVGVGVLVAGVLLAVGPVPVVGYTVTGIGQGLFAVPFFASALHRVRPSETGSAAGLLNSTQQLGGTLGVALLGTVFFRTGDTTAWWVAVGLLAATYVTSALMAQPRAAAEQPVA